jgi:hypothetical protein
MTTIDFEQARAAHLALKEFFALHPKGPLNPALLADVQALCRAADRAVPDLDCRRALRSIETYSELLIARDSPARGADLRPRAHRLRSDGDLRVILLPGRAALRSRSGRGCPSSAGGTRRPGGSASRPAR